MNYQKYSKMSEALRQWRREHHYTLQQAAHVSKITRSALISMEGDKIIPRWVNIDRLAVIFNTTPGEIYNHFYWNNKKDQ